MMTVKGFLRRLMYENGNPSLTRLMAVWGLLLFTGVTLWVVAVRYDWRDYAAFGGLTVGGGLATIVANKGINSKWNTPPGSPGPRGE